MLRRVYSLLHSRRIGQKKIAVLSKFTGNRKRIAQKNQKKIEVHGRKTGFSSFPDYQENENGKWEMVRKMNVFLGLDPSLILAIQTLIKRSGKNKTGETLTKILKKYLDPQIINPKKLFFWLITRDL